MTHSVGCTASFTQVAGIEAIRGNQEQVDVVLGEYKQRRDFLVKGLNDIPGITCQMPKGAFYVFPNITALGHKSDYVADYILEKPG